MNEGEDVARGQEERFCLFFQKVCEKTVLHHFLSTLDRQIDHGVY